MAKTDRIQVRIDPKTKEQAAELFDRLGITFSDAVSLFVHQSLAEGGLPFQVEQRLRKDERVARQLS